MTKSQTLDNKSRLATKIRTGIDIWQSDNKHKVQVLLDDLKLHNPRAQISRGHISKIRTGRLEEVRASLMEEICLALDALLSKWGYVYQESLMQWHNPEQPSGSATLKGQYPFPANQNLGNLAGWYVGYHSAKLGQKILQTYLCLHPNGDATLYGLNGMQYRGKAWRSLQSLLTVWCFEAKPKEDTAYPFFLQIIVEVGNYALFDYAAGHFVGIRQTVSMENEPMAIRQVLMPLASPPISVEAQLLAPDDATMQAIEQKKEGIVAFLTSEESILLSPHRANGQLTGNK